MTRFPLRAAVVVAVTLLAVPVFAQEPGKDENDCKPSALMSRMPGCGIYECSKKDFDSFEVVLNKAAETKTLEGEVEQLRLICPTNASQLQLMRNAEAALKKSGYVTVYTGPHANSDFPVVTAHKGAQWVMVQTENFNEFPAYTQTAVLVKEMAQEMSATAQAMSDAIAKSGKLDVYGITFATGQRLG